MTPHVHILSDGKLVGTAWLDGNGHVVDDGTPAVRNAIRGINHHGLGRHHGQALLNSIVKRLDSATRVAAVHCNKDDLPRSHTGAIKSPLFHWVDAKELEKWMDPAHTGPGHTYLTESGQDPNQEWNDDIPTFENPVRLTIDHDQLNPELFDQDYNGWLGNYLYHGVIPPEAVTDIKSFKAPKHWQQNVEPAADDHWEDYSDDERHHNDVSFSNDTRMLA